jgi:uncharacterized protein YlxW (UPF0749 family)
MTMSGDDSVEAETGRGLLRRLAYQPSRPHLMIGALFLLLGLLITVVVIAPSGDEDEWRNARTEDLVQVLDDLSARQARLEEESSRLAELRRDLESGSTAEALAEARRQLEALRVMSGTTPVSGAGVQITIDDPEGQIDAAVLINAVQELRDAGAEAIQVGETRVTVDSWFADSEEGVTIEGTSLGRSFDLVAIGEPETISAAMSIPGGLAESVRTRGAEFRTTSDPNLTISVTVPVTAAP